MVSGSSTNYGSLSRRLNPENEPCFISDSLLLSVGDCVAGQMIEGRACMSSRLLHHHIASTNQQRLLLPCPPQLCSKVSSCAFPSHHHYHLFTHIHPSKWHCKLLRVTFFFFLAQAVLHTNTYCNQYWSDSRFLKHHKYWTISEAHLRCPVAA